jgi:hypothetical protein
MLAGREDVEADLLGLLRDDRHRLDPLVPGRGPARNRVGGDIADGEDPELHRPHLSPYIYMTRQQYWATPDARRPTRGGGVRPMVRQ